MRACASQLLHPGMSWQPAPVTAGTPSGVVSACPLCSVECFPEQMFRRRSRNVFIARVSGSCRTAAGQQRATFAWTLIFKKVYLKIVLVDNEIIRIKIYSQYISELTDDL